MKLERLMRLLLFWSQGVSMLCQVKLNSMPSSPSILVVTTNDSGWEYLPLLNTWAKEARRSRLLQDDSNDVTTLSDRLYSRGGFNKLVLQEDGCNMMRAWDEAKERGIRAAEEALQNVWNSICEETPTIEHRRTFKQPKIAKALAFNFKNGPLEPRERCVRCRILFQFEMSAFEPFRYEGPFFRDRLSCAEVTAYAKCELSRTFPRRSTSVKRRK